MTVVRVKASAPSCATIYRTLPPPALRPGHVRLARRELVWVNVTAHPTADWIAQQITEAFPWDQAPRYLIRDRDGVYGAVVTRRLRAMGIRDKPISAGSPDEVLGTHTVEPQDGVTREDIEFAVCFARAELCAR